MRRRSSHRHRAEAFSRPEAVRGQASDPPHRGLAEGPGQNSGGVQGGGRIYRREAADPCNPRGRQEHSHRRAEGDMQGAGRAPAEIRWRVEPRGTGAFHPGVRQGEGHEAGRRGQASTGSADRLQRLAWPLRGDMGRREGGVHRPFRGLRQGAQPRQGGGEGTGRGGGASKGGAREAGCCQGRRRGARGGAVGRPGSPDQGYWRRDPGPQGEAEGWGRQRQTDRQDRGGEGPGGPAHGPEGGAGEGPGGCSHGRPGTPRCGRRHQGGARRAGQGGRRQHP
mmetsp:Transcript_10674/g.28282  ORF Transcript_10674/g.28282 Transcript_10674/m.28282 type:complete len:280 (-) Transcript_10674:231-1070(-)